MESEYGNLTSNCKIHKFSRKEKLMKYQSRNRNNLSHKNFSNMSREESLEKIEYYKDFLSSFRNRKNSASSVRQSKKEVSSRTSKVCDKITFKVPSKPGKLKLTPVPKSPCPDKVPKDLEEPKSSRKD